MRLSIKVKIFSLFSLFPLLVACAPAPHAMDSQPRTVENKPQASGKPECAIFQSHGFVCPEQMLPMIDVRSCQFNQKFDEIHCDSSSLGESSSTGGYSFDRNGGMSASIQ